jgi:inorganic pyrophosphatase
MNNDDIKKIVKDEIEKFVKTYLDIELKKILGNLSSQSRQELANAMKKAFEAVYKVLWQKRSFWATDIK